MTTLQAITEKLQELRLAGSTRSYRPLLCGGSPIGCEVAIVGINPAIDLPLEDFWDPLTGCDKAGWLAASRKNRENERKPTRAAIEWLVEELRPVRCLELNIYPYYAPSLKELKELPSDYRKTDVFFYLLSTIKPKLLFAFGEPPIKELRKRLKVPALPKGVYTPCCYDGARFEVYADSHLVPTNGWSQNRVQALAREFKNRILAQRG